MHSRRIYWGKRCIHLSSKESSHTEMDQWKFSEIGELRIRMQEWLNAPDQKDLWIQHEQLSVLKKAFNRCFPKVKAAGGFVFDQKGRMLWIRRKGYWDQPKGKQEKNEMRVICALREVEEETGVVVDDVLSKAGKTYHLFDDKGILSQKVTHWYYMRAHSGAALKPQLEEQIEEVIWVEKEQIPEFIDKTYPAIRYLLSDLKT